MRVAPWSASRIAAGAVWLCAILAAAATIGCWRPAVATAAGIERIGRAPALARAARVLGPLNGARQLHVTVALRPRDPAALAAFVAAISDPRSPDYRDFLNPRQFAQRFAPTPKQAAAVRAALRARGLKPGPVSPNGLSIPLKASVAALQRAFSVALVRVRLPNGTQAIFSTRAPALGAGVAPLVQAVIGLSGTPGPRPLRVVPARQAVRAQAARSTGQLVGGTRAARSTARPVAAGPTPCAAASSAAASQGAYTANQIAAAYGFNGLYAAGDEGQGETIALYELEPFSAQDIATFAACYGLHPNLYEVNVDGGPDSSGPGSGEAALDIEQTIVMAPRARVIVYEGPNSNANGPGSGPYDVLSAIVNQDLAQVVSTSWGQCEALEGKADAGAEETLLEEAAAQGQSVLAAAGDSGSEDCYGQTPTPDSALAVDDPGSDPYATSVGGTALTNIGPPPTETVWNSGDSANAPLGLAAGAGGGGLSSFWPMPAYQRNAPAALHVINPYSSGAPCGAGARLCREVPDVSADADPNTGYEIYYNGAASAGAGVPSGWQATGGTSAATPLWAALVALADADRACGGIPIGFLNPALYRAAADAYARDFHDITTGNNDFTGTHGGLYPAGPGFDMASGLGTPNATALAASLCGAALRPRPPGNQTSTVGGRVRLALHVADAAGAHLGFYARGLPAGLSISRRGVIAGRPRRRGTYHPVVLIEDRDADVRLLSLTWMVLPAPRLVHVQLRGVLAGRPALSLTLRVARGAPGLRRVEVHLPVGARFAPRPRRLLVLGLRGARLRHRARVVKGALVVMLLAPQRWLRLSVRYPSITVTRTLSAQVRAHRARRLTILVQATDAHGESTTLRAGRLDHMEERPAGRRR